VRIPLDRDGGVPLWRQIERFIRNEIESGALPPGTRLASTRALASESGVSRVTAESVYLALATDGMILSRPGSGTFVASSAHTARAPAGDDEPLPEWQQRFTHPDDSPAATATPDGGSSDIIAFTGVGDPAGFPIREIAVTVADVIRSDGSATFAYAAGNLGFAPLRATVTHLLASQGIHTSADRVLITSGSQQALFLVAWTLLERGDTVVVERPTYDGALALFDALGVRTVGIDVDADGMRVDELDDVIERYHPKLIYTIPTSRTRPERACRHRAVIG